MIFNDESKVVNDPLKGTLGVRQHAADVSREPVECAPFHGQLRPGSHFCLPIVPFPSDHGRSVTHCGPEVLVLYQKRTQEEKLVAWSESGRSLLIQRLEGSRFVRGGRDGISIDFRLEVVETQSVCGTIAESEFIEPTKKLKLTIAPL